MMKEGMSTGAKAPFTATELTEDVLIKMDMLRKNIEVLKEKLAPVTSANAEVRCESKDDPLSASMSPLGVSLSTLSRNIDLADQEIRDLAASVQI